ncbi:glycosyltransferase family 4 protein [Nitrospira lenta]|uniref:Glycosyl transferase, group 1 n=1 Tax=Nitrospira lenta TaxID=1436998 RepID=A0A330L0X2_9BACT|nr:glycosyltransferase family 4 protein [Nitrospira lenta]SPP62987.1 hypothetical protein NITLEN_10073 [Nitrospira lenta]
MSDKPKLLIIGPTPPPFHGVSVAVQTLLQSKLMEAYDVTHLELADRRGIGHVNQPDLQDVWLFLGQWARLLRLLMRTRPQVVYLVLSQTTVGFLRDSFFLWPAWLFGARVVVHLHSGALQAWYRSRSLPMRGYARVVLARVTKAIVLGDQLRSEFDGLLPADRIAVVPNGVECVDEWIDRAPPVSSQPWRILHLNTLNRMKGTLVLLAAIPAVLRSRQDVEFILAGPWSHEDHRAEAERYIAQHGLGRYVTFTGQVSGDEKRSLLRSADLFVFPGIQREGQPFVVLEAMAAGLPIIFTNQGCLRETVVHGDSGLEVQCNDPDDLARQLLWLMERPDECLRLGKAARRRCQAVFSRDGHIEQMLHLFQDVLTDASTHRRPSISASQPR